MRPLANHGLDMASRVTRAGYSLVICEKPDAGRRIARALGNGRRIKIGRVEVLEVNNSFDGKHYVICSSSGHLYGITDRPSKRSVYPVFDLEWVPLHMIQKERPLRRSEGYRAFCRNRIDAIRALAREAKEFVHACDYDIEGETIGSNILKFACGVTSTENCRRAKFSTLSDSEIRYSFSNLETLKQYRAEAGRLRHEVDFIWGINLSRALTGAYSKSGHGFRNFSIGRVQGPTLSFVADREIEINSHVPVPYWRIFAKFRKEGNIFGAEFEKRIKVKTEADEILLDVSRERKGEVESIRDLTFEVKPPVPFDLGTLQSESFRNFKLTPSQTLRIAEKLYLRALISYPRTGSQMLPPSIGYEKIIQGLTLIPRYQSLAGQIVMFGKKTPRQGVKFDTAHPAIHPTGANPGKLDNSESKIFDLIVRRFLASFSEDALFSSSSVHISVASKLFEAVGRKVLREGWMMTYPTETRAARSDIPLLNVRDSVDLLSANVEGEFERKPDRYTQSSLLQLMEEQNLGTKATRGEIISKLLERGYLIERSSHGLVASETGIVVIETMRNRCKDIVSPDLTRRVESEIKGIYEGSVPKTDILGESRDAISAAVDKIKRSEQQLGGELFNSVLIGNNQIILGKCPECARGNLGVIRSPRTGKRFIGCSEYKNGCKASAPLPQKGKIRNQNGICPSCHWPLVSLFLPARRPWIFCPNQHCSGKK